MKAGLKLWQLKVKKNQPVSPLNLECPQEEVLVPGLYMYYLNDILIGLNSTIRLFADDAIACMAIKMQNISKTISTNLHHGKKHGKWLFIHINITSSLSPICQSDQIQLQHPRSIPRVFRRRLKLKSHINNDCTKANNKLDSLRPNLSISSTFVGEQAYESLVKQSL